MPQIIVTAGDGERSVTLRERVSASDFESDRFAVNLVERLGWAVDDATEVEREPGEERSEPRHQRKGRITGKPRRDPDHEPDLEPVGSA
jgi:hypothetical protein